MGCDPLMTQVQDLGSLFDAPPEEVLAMLQAAWYPPVVTYPDGHGTMCPRSCEHPSHESLETWLECHLPGDTPTTDPTTTESHERT